MKKNSNDEEKLMCEKVGRRLCEIRKSKNLTQKEAADYLGVSQSNISQLENDARKFSVYSIKKLIELYDSDYESVLGAAGIKKKEISLKAEEPFPGMEVLRDLCENAGSKDLSQAVNIYVNICIYVVLRELYEANPRNTDSVFSIKKSEALKRAKKFINQTPDHLSAFVNASNGQVKKKSIEPSLEKACDFREFVEVCETFIKNYLSEE